MKVILMQKVERLGEPGQQLEVADGYARNYLLPKQLAVPATPGRMRSLAQLTAQAKNREDRVKKDAESLAAKLQGVEITFFRRAAEEPAAPAPVAAPPEGATPAPEPVPEPVQAAQSLAGPRLFGSVTNQDVSEALAERGLTVDRKKVHLEEPIKTLGVHTVPLRLHPEVTASVTVKVEREA